jgi:hypothetical protein
MELTQNELTVNGKKYLLADSVQPAAQFNGDTKIVVLQRGWVMVGKLEKTGSDCKLHNASVIRAWGTTKGLGEIAAEGPKSSTKLDKCNGLVEFDSLTVVCSIACNEEKWKNAL